MPATVLPQGNQPPPPPWVDPLNQWQLPGPGANPLAGLPQLGAGGAASGTMTPQQALQYDQLQGAYLNARQANVLGGQALDVGMIGRESQGIADTAKLTGQDIARARDNATRQYGEDVKATKGALAAQGATTSDAAKQALGSKASGWNMGREGDLQHNLQNTYADLYSQAAKANIQEQLQQGGLYNQLGHLGLTTQQQLAQLAVQRDLLGQNLSADTAAILAGQ
jgi:hypothetical protein